MNQDFQFANLNQKTKEELDRLEAQLSRDCRRPIVLVAYERNAGREEER